MGKLEEAQEILKELGLPNAQQNDISAYTLLALCGLTEDGAWKDVKRESKTITKGIMDWLVATYDKRYAPNTRETFRRQVLHQFEQARVVDYNPDIPDLATNSPRAHYKLTEAARKAIVTYGTKAWQSQAADFIVKQGSLAARYKKARAKAGVPLTLDGKAFTLSPGKHNEVQAAVVTEFAPRFAPGAVLVYLGDTAKKHLIVNQSYIKSLGIILDHDKLPDVILYDTGKNWVYLIEVVTSHGPVSPKRVTELEKMFAACKTQIIYVSAFPDLATFRKFLKDTAWDTEVWLADAPDHMIHMNGDRFLGPR